jgi:hypothetical protein
LYKREERRREKSSTVERRRDVAATKNVGLQPKMLGCNLNIRKGNTNM